MRELLKHLEAEEIPPTRLTVDTLVRGGRRKQQRRRIIAAATAVALLPLGIAFGTLPDEPIANGFPESCAGRRLPLPEGRTFGAGIDDADPTGHHIVGRLDGNVVLWRGASVKVLDPPGQALNTVVNSAGVVAGTSTDGSWDPSLGAPPPEIGVSTTAWVLKDGAFTVLRDPDGSADNLLVSGINARGDIVGGTRSGDPLVWQGDGLTPRALPEPEGNRKVDATAIDDDGTIVGSDFTRLSTGWVSWVDGALRQQAAPQHTVMLAIRNGRAISSAPAPETSYLWDLRTGQVTPLADRMSRAIDINHAGWIVGVLEDGMPGVIDPAGEKSLRLPAVATAPGAGWPVAVLGAMSISDDGRVVTAQLNVDKRDYPVRWICS